MDVMGRTWAAACVAAIAWAHAGVAAQTAPSWIVVPAQAEDLSEEARRLAQAAEGALAERGQRVLGADALPDLGTEPQTIPAELRERLETTVRQAIEDVGFGRRARAFERINPLLAEVETYLDALGGDPAVSRAVTDLLLVAARAHRESHDEAAARATIERLISMVPEPDPTVANHPHTMLEMLSAARARLREGHAPARLYVQALDRGSCAAYLNGRLVGPTPLQLALYAGNYAVRVQCGDARSRIHFVHLDAGSAHVEVAASLEAAIRERPHLHLRYDREAPNWKARHDAATLATLARADRALLIRIGEDEAALEVVTANGQLVASTTTSLAPTAAELRAAWATLLSPAEPSGGSRPSEWNLVIGGALVGAGVAALIYPIATLAQLGRCVNSEGLPEGWCREEIVFGPVSTTLTVVGLAAIAAGIVWWITEPIHVAVAAEPTSARLQLGGRF